MHFSGLFLSVIEALRGLVYEATAKFNKDLSKEMGNFIIAMLKIFIGGIGLAGMLMVWGINVTAVLASLGLGGLPLPWLPKILLQISLDHLPCLQINLFVLASGSKWVV